MTEPARVRLQHLISGFIVTQTVGTIVRLGIPQLVSERARSAAELAEASGADPDALRRGLRMLASKGVFAAQGGVIVHTELSELLHPGVPGSLEGQARLFASLHYETWGDSFETFRTGEPAFPRLHGRPLFDWFSDHPEEAETFNRAMAGGAAGRRGVLFERDWSDVRTVVDVGGGTAATLTAVLAANAHLHGIVFDLEHAREDAERTIREAALADRCSFVAGSFFEAVPPGADAYVLSAILHDWDDERARAILRTCRAAAHRESRLILVEAILAEGDEPDWMKVLDLHMLVVLGGRERSEAEWGALLETGGFRLDAARNGLLEASPA